MLADLFASRAEDDKVSAPARGVRADAAPVAAPVPPPPVSFMRYGAETDAFVLVDCNGAVATEAMDPLSSWPARRRPPPGALLPDEPDAEAWRAASGSTRRRCTRASSG